MKRPYIKKGPASPYATPNEVIVEFGNGTGDGGLISIRNVDGRMHVNVYRVSESVVVHVRKEAV